MIDNVSHGLGALSIKKLVLIQREFGDLERFQRMLSLANENIFREEFVFASSWLGYILLTEKEYFKNLRDFRLRFARQKLEIYQENVSVLIKVIEESQPIVARSKKDVSEGDENQFSRSYAYIAREIGLTVDQFYELTFRQINQILEDLNFLKKCDQAFMAQIHGAKLLTPPDNRPSAEINFTKREDEILRRHSRKRLEQMRNEGHCFKS